jgi:hypothetical protein
MVGRDGMRESLHVHLFESVVFAVFVRELVSERARGQFVSKWRAAF